MADFVLGGRSFALSGPMRLKQLKRALPLIASINVANVAGEIDKMVEVLKIALSVDYPDVDLDELPASLDEVADALNVLMEVNGFEKKAASSGEAQAGVDSISTTSAAG